jgi:hypothetical protein
LCAVDDIAAGQFAVGDPAGLINVTLLAAFAPDQGG